MEFIKKHYEKVILAAVLIGLIILLGLMWFVIQHDKQTMADTAQNILPRPQALAALDLSHQDGVMQRLQQPHLLDFSETNKLFNPVQWMKAPNGALQKISTSRQYGPGAAVVAKITPLYFTIRLDSVETNLATPHYKFFVEHQAAPLPAQRHAVPHFAATNDVLKGIFKLVSVQGPPENPDAVTVNLQLPSGESIAVRKDKPFQRIEGYSADVKYDVQQEHAGGKDLRVGDPLNFAGDQYNIIAINQNEVVLLANSNQKQYHLRYSR